MYAPTTKFSPWTPLSVTLEAYAIQTSLSCFSLNGLLTASPFIAPMVFFLFSSTGIPFLLLFYHRNLSCQLLIFKEHEDVVGR